MDTDAAFAGLGAFLSGAGSVIGGLYALKILRRRMSKDCEEHLRLYREGIEMGRQLHDDEKEPE